MNVLATISTVEDPVGRGFIMSLCIQKICANFEPSKWVGNVPVILFSPTNHLFRNLPRKFPNTLSKPHLGDV